MTSKSIVIASDLDRTLIYSSAATITLGTLETSGSVDEPPLLFPKDVTCVEHYKDKPPSFMTKQALIYLHEICGLATFVPVTTRTPDQFRRVRLFKEAPAYAICSNGGDLLVNGVLDDDWRHSIQATISKESAPLGQVKSHIGEIVAPLIGDGIARLHTASDLFAYVVIEPGAKERIGLPALREWASERGWVLSDQGRKLYCVPLSLTKYKAVSEVAQRTNCSSVVSAGDSLLDIDLLTRADISIRPAHSELHDRKWVHPTTSVTLASGIAAGEEILKWFLDETLRRNEKTRPSTSTHEETSVETKREAHR